PLLRKAFSAIKIFYISFTMAVVGYLVLLVLAFTDMSSVALLFIPAFLIFAAIGMLNVLTTIFLANTVDYGEVKNNRRDESVIFSMQTFVVKLASGIAAFVASICLAVCNLSDDTSEGAAVISENSSVLGLRMTMTVVPIVVLLAAVFVFYKNYILTDEKVAELAKEIEETRAGREC
ncbi:MAG: MFS transporter, partial [Clostridiales bacterium]|nr:MFS transporter [Clostridiales bacterium]